MSAQSRTQNSSIYTQISNSERFLVADQQDGWVKIEIDDQDAYLSSDYVDVKYGLEEAIKYTPVVEVADTSSKNDSKNSQRIIPIRRTAQTTGLPDRSPEVFPPNVPRSQTTQFSSSETDMSTAERA